MAFKRQMGKYERAYKKKFKVKNDKKLPDRVPESLAEEWTVYCASGGDPEQAEYIEKQWPLSRLSMWGQFSQL